MRRRISVGTGNVAPFFGHATNMVAGTPLALYEPDARDRRSLRHLASAEAGGELVVGATGRNGPGEVFTFSAFPVGNPNVWVIEMTNEYKQSDIAGEAGHTGDNFGESVAIGDIDGDSYLDVIVGVPGKPVSGDTAAGEIAIYPRYSAGKVMKPTAPNAEDNFGSSVAVGNFDRGAQSVVHSSTNDLAVGIPDRAVGTAARAGVFNTYKGTAQTLWRQFTEATHNGP